MLRSQGREPSGALHSGRPGALGVLTRPLERGAMQTKTVGFISATMAGALLFKGVAISTSSDTTHGLTRSVQSTHAVLAADMVPTINLDNCPTLAMGYHGGCVNQLQTELNTIDGANLPVDGTFGPATQSAVETFQEKYGISPVDGVVGPQTKAALDNPVSNSVATPQPGSAQPAEPNCSQDATQGPPSASIPPGQQSYFQCQPPGQPGPNVTSGCILDIAGLGLAGLTVSGSVVDIAALAGAGIGGLAYEKDC